MAINLKDVKNLFKPKEDYTQHATVLMLPVDKIEPSPFQARTVFDQREIKKLAVSILQNGLLQPVSVRSVGENRWQLIAGERRLRAFTIAGLKEIPAIVYKLKDEQTAALGLLENLQREQLNPFEQARSLRDLLNLWNCTQEQAARRLGMAQPTLANKLRLLALTQVQEEICTTAKLTERHARAVLRLATIEMRTKALEIIIAKNYNVQQTEDYVQTIIAETQGPKKRVMVRDVRIFVNTINRAVELMTASGIPAVAKRSEEADYIEYVVRIPTYSATLNQSKEQGRQETKTVDMTEEIINKTSKSLIEQIEKQVADIQINDMQTQSV